MRYTVTDNCMLCSMCAGICPQVFSMGDDGYSHAISEDVPPEWEDAARDAMISCPAGAIEPIE